MVRAEITIDFKKFSIVYQVYDVGLLCRFIMVKARSATSGVTLPDGFYVPEPEYTVPLVSTGSQMPPWAIAGM